MKDYRTYLLDVFSGVNNLESILFSLIFQQTAQSFSCRFEISLQVLEQISVDLIGQEIAVDIGPLKHITSFHQTKSSSFDELNINPRRSRSHLTLETNTQYKIKDLPLLGQFTHQSVSLVEQFVFELGRLSVDLETRDKVHKLVQLGTLAVLVETALFFQLVARVGDVIERSQALRNKTTLGLET